MIPDESSDCEMIETRQLVPTDIFTEATAEGVVLTIAADDTAEDIAILLPRERARELGDVLFRLGCA